MEIQNLLFPIKNKLVETEKFIQQKFNEELKIIQKIRKYTLNNKGKRIRPAILILITNCFTENSAQTPQVASIIEYIHTASLMHDDVIDEAEYRRHQKTSHKIWGNKTTILAGDYILAKALEQLANLQNTDLLKLITRAVAALAKGEILQLLHSIENNSIKKYLEIIELKTANLMASAMQAGGILTGQKEKMQQQLFCCGKNLGMAFQITDDILDYQGQTTGKEIGKDFQEKKITLPLCKLLSASNLLEKEKVREIFSQEKINNSDLQEILGLMQKKDVFSTCLKEAQKYKLQAQEFILQLPKNPYQKTLLDLSDFVIHRIY